MSTIIKNSTMHIDWTCVERYSDLDGNLFMRPRKTVIGLWKLDAG